MLAQLYKELQAEQGEIDRSSDAFQSIKELARRFSLSFGLDQVKNREAVAAMHRSAVLYNCCHQSDLLNLRIIGIRDNLCFSNFKVAGFFWEYLLRLELGGLHSNL